MHALNMTLKSNFSFLEPVVYIRNMYSKIQFSVYSTLY
jgi:hypothetical protein